MSNHDKKQNVLKNFIVLEGIDGAGTTTQLTMFKDRCFLNGIPCFPTCEPTSGPIGLLIRRYMSGKEPIDPATLAYLFAADRNEHLHSWDTGIIAASGHGSVVISDRYLFSSLAYQSVECGFDFIFELNARFPLPEYLIYVEVPVAVGQQRIEERLEKEIFENESFQKKVISGYEKAFEKYSRSGIKTLRIDGRKRPADIADEIWRFVNLVPIQET